LTVPEPRTILITGATSGLGRALATELAPRGGRLLVHARDEAKGAALVSELSELDGAGEVVLYLADLASLADVGLLAQKVSAEEERLDVLVNNAGVGVGAAVGELDTKKVDLQLATNLRSTILFYRECRELLGAAAAEHRNALVVNMASIAGRSGQPWLSVYGATKAAMINFSQAMDKELAPEGIKSTALCPAFVDTAMSDFVKGRIAAEDMITTADVAEAVRFLLRLSPNCVIPEITFMRPDELL
jgi:NAD(P)-dependent dehydrogenase (short-subunit alcohol dehydrogenase family)